MNRRISSRKKPNHISSLFFFITDKIAKGEIDLEYCPTNKMWCDILNNPNQGAPYSLDRSHLMNFSLDYDEEVESKATHHALLDTKKYDNIMVPPLN